MQLKLKNHHTSTLVPNRFIECCVDAPEKYTAAYLLALKFASSDGGADFDMLCARLDFSKEDFIEAFEYWQKKGLARIHNGTRISLDFGDFAPPELASDDLYTEREFNQMLQNLFGTRDRKSVV